MARGTLPTAQVLELLRLTPARLGEVGRSLTPEQLRIRPEPDEWSAVEVLAHLRACADRWGDAATRIVREDHPTIQGINPRRWVESTDYPTLEFAASLRAFEAQRRELLAVLEPLSPEQWQRTGTTVGAGAPLTHTVHDYGERLALHERPHVKQVHRLLLVP